MVGRVEMRRGEEKGSLPTPEVQEIKKVEDGLAEWLRELDTLIERGISVSIKTYLNEISGAEPSRRATGSTACAVGMDRNDQP